MAYFRSCIVTLIIVNFLSRWLLTSASSIFMGGGLLGLLGQQGTNLRLFYHSLFQTLMRTCSAKTHLLESEYFFAVVPTRNVPVRILGADYHQGQQYVPIMTLISWQAVHQPIPISQWIFYYMFLLQILKWSFIVHNNANFICAFKVALH